MPEQLNEPRDQGWLIKDHHLRVANRTGETIAMEALDAYGDNWIQQGSEGQLRWNQDPIKPVDDTDTFVKFTLPQFDPGPVFVMELLNAAFQRPGVQLTGPFGVNPPEWQWLSEGDQVRFVFNRQSLSNPNVPVFTVSRKPNSSFIEWFVDLTVLAATHGGTDGEA
jgi:hypothetical protein